MSRFTNITITEHDDATLDSGKGHAFAGLDGDMSFQASFPLWLISEARDRGCDFEDLADGYGPGLGTMSGDWSGIRDSTPEAVAAMLERALNHMFEFRGYLAGRPA